MKRILYMLCAMVLAVGTAQAQPQGYSYALGGSAFTNDALSTSDFFSLSQQQFHFASARSMAMAGAFTSLGADQASLTINPAGLGMYQHGEFAITPLITNTKAETAGTLPFESNTKSRFSLGNIGAVFNVYEGSGSWLSVNMGVGYTRLADYNYNYSFAYGPSVGNASIADAMSVMLEAGGAVVDHNGRVSMGGMPDWFIDPFFWPAVAGYKSYMVDQNEAGVWYPGEIGDNAAVEGATSVRSRGSAGEISFAIGGNYNNKLYVGATIGIMSLYQRQDIYYGESYSYDGGNGYDSPTKAVYADGTLLPSVMQAMGMMQSMRVDGVGVNFKLGVVYRPIESLRLGLALHTPTYYSLDRRYGLSMSTVSLGETSPTDPTTHEYTSDVFSDVLEDNGPNSWDFYSPTRLMVGASYTLGRFAILSVDYERTWYNGIRVKGQPYLPYGPGESDFKQDFKNYFQGGNTLRVGLEVRPVPMMALRVGYGYSGSALKEETTILSKPANYETTCYTAGLGFNLGRVCYLDLAYCYATNQMTEYMLFYGNRYPESYSSEPAEIYESGRFKTELEQHNFALTFGVRF